MEEDKEFFDEHPEITAVLLAVCFIGLYMAIWLLK